MNVITIAGSVGKDAEVKYLQNGDAVCSFSVADSEGRDKPTIWWNCSLFGKRAESLSQYITKGSKVTVTGRITERSYTDKSGQDRKVMDVRVSDIALQGKAGGSHDEPVQSVNVSKKQAVPDLDDDMLDVPF